MSIKKMLEKMDEKTDQERALSWDSFNTITYCDKNKVKWNILR